jgi:hypothetical protein
MGRYGLVALLAPVLLLLASCSQPEAPLALPTDLEVEALEAALFPNDDTALATTCAPMQTLVPLYIYPSRTGLASWRTVANLNKIAQVTAIINPASGPGGPPNPDYLTGMSLLRTSGVRLAGYVHTNYGNRSLNLVKADLATYHQYFNLSAFFIDTVNNTTSTLAYYTELYNYIKGLNPTYQVILNPGTAIDESYLTAPAGDLVIVSEDYYSRWLSYRSPAYAGGYPSAQLGAIIHTATSTTRLKNAVQLARQRNIGWFYATNFTMPNPWKKLPSSSYLNSLARYLGCAAQR